MRISSKEALVLAAAELRPDAPAAVLRKETGLRDHTIRYALRQLRERGIASRIPYVNLHRLGYVTFNLFFSIGAQRRAQKEALLKAFMSAPEVVWIGEFGGEYQYGIAVCTKQVGGVLEFVHGLSGKYQHVFFEKAVSCQYSATTFGRRYLCAKHMSAKPLVSRYVNEVVVPDETDDKLLRAMASNGEASHRQLAAETGIPASTIDLRIKRLEEKQVIVGSLLAVNAAALGMQSFKLLIYAKGLNSSLSEALSRYCDQHAQIVYLIECLGSWDYEIGVEVSKPEEVTTVIQEIYEQFGAVVTSVKLLTKFNDLKFRWYPG